MAMYVDGFVIPMPKKNIAAYRRIAEVMKKLLKKHGALEYVEAAGDDLNPDSMGVKIATFPKLTKAKSGETVIFSFVVFRSRAHRDAVNKKVWKDMEKMEDLHMPFDMKRMAYGGFKTIVEL